ncbi:hypothetical protein GCM10022254_64950 [Actinomadura meridiana]|uniref:DUF2867 domain-containing protein n=1 Tax=Actinomadura meridiana TaxID=559626 RepID=A0ABP8CKP5_9ACTN
MGTMRLKAADHTGQPWRIHEITRDFELKDVWSFCTPAIGPDGFPAALAAIEATYAPTASTLPAPVRLLFTTRRRLGTLFGWDDEAEGLAKRVRSLRARLPKDLAEGRTGSSAEGLPFTPLYELDNECARELANRVVHAVMHLSWAPTTDGGHELRMAVLVKPNGRFGQLYMAAIGPFRYVIVYPMMIRRWEAAMRTAATSRVRDTSAI